MESGNLGLGKNSNELQSSNEKLLYEKFDAIISKFKESKLQEDVKVLEFIKDHALPEFLKDFKIHNTNKWDVNKIKTLEDNSTKEGQNGIFFLLPIRYQKISEDAKLAEPDFKTKLSLGTKIAKTEITEEEKAGNFLDNGVNVPKNYSSISKEGIALMTQALGAVSEIPVKHYFDSFKDKTMKEIETILSKTKVEGISILYGVENMGQLFESRTKKIRNGEVRLKENDNKNVNSETEYYALAFEKEFFK